MSETFALNNPGTLMVVVGLPGSGKTAYINKLVSEQADFVAYDDYQGEAFAKNHDPRLSKHFGQLCADLIDGKTVVVSDVRLSVPAELGKFLGAVLSVAPNTKLEFHQFTNEPVLSYQNVTARNRKERVERELELIDNLSPIYTTVVVNTIPTYIGANEPNYGQEKAWVIVYKKLDNTLRLLCLKPNPEPGRNSDYYVVTGGVEDGETPEAAAAREVKEEIGVEPRQVFDLSRELTYEDALDGKTYVEHCFAAKIDDGPIKLNEEHVDYKWADESEFVETIWWEYDRQILRDLIARLKEHENNS